MKNKCYKLLPRRAFYGCKEQCMECERKELLGRSDTGAIPEEEEKLYTRDQMIIFAGFCMGKKMTNPGMDVGEIFSEYEVTFNHG